MSSTVGNNRLASLAAEIRTLDANIQRNALQVAEDAIAAGHRLLEAKELVPHGEWQDWLRDNVALSVRSAQRYMRLARSGLKSDTVSLLGLRAALESIASHQAAREVESELKAEGLEGETAQLTAVFRSLGCRGTFSPTSWTPPTDMTPEEFQHVGKVLISFHKMTHPADA